MGIVSVQLTNFFSVDDQLEELEDGEDVAIMFEKLNMLEEKDNREAFKDSLQIIGRKDLVMKLEIYLAAGT